jgi:hypothetical protein
MAESTVVRFGGSLPFRKRIPSLRDAPWSAQGALNVLVANAMHLSVPYLTHPPFFVPVLR